MINAADEDGSGLDDRDVAGNVLVMLLAGEDTTANTLAWLLHFPHANPEVERRARDEVMRWRRTLRLTHTPRDDRRTRLC